ncbi:MAG: hypothetical protein J7M30_13230, partial [Deltaproteobacteria bacterium]|nr:hypothetical protein [Deltaproteobacteria bacterium]
MEKNRFRLLPGVFVIIVTLLVCSSLLQAGEYISLYTYYGQPSYAYGSSDKTCAEGMQDDDRYTDCKVINS